MEWVDIREYTGLYFINNIGAIKNKNGTIKKSRKCTNGYLKVTLSKNGKKTTHLVHRLVATAFIDNHSNLKYVNHKNGNKADNRAENLEWVTPKQNANHAIENGLTPIGEDCTNAKYTEKDAINVIELYNKGYSRKDIIKITGVSFHVVKGIRARTRWKHLSHLLKIGG